MAEEIRRTPRHKRTEVLSAAALAEQRQKSPSTCKSHDEQVPALHPTPLPTTAQAIKTWPTFPCWLCGNHGQASRDCLKIMHSTNSLRYCTNYQHTGYGGLNKTYQNLTDKYHWKDSCSDIKKFVECCEICHATKSTT